VFVLIYEQNCFRYNQAKISIKQIHLVLQLEENSVEDSDSINGRAEDMNESVKLMLTESGFVSGRLYKLVIWFRAQ